MKINRLILILIVVLFSGPQCNFAGASDVTTRPTPLPNPLLAWDWKLEISRSPNSNQKANRQWLRESRRHSGSWRCHYRHLFA